MKKIFVISILSMMLLMIILGGYNLSNACRDVSDNEAMNMQSIFVAK